MRRRPERSDRQEACHPELNEGSAGRDASLTPGMRQCWRFFEHPRQDAEIYHIK